MAEDRLAARWFAVRAEFQQLGRLGRVGLWLRELLKLFASLGLTAGEDGARRFCDVIVFVRTDSRPVLVFQYKHLGQATVHAHDLVGRLNTLDVEDFCGSLDLDPDLASGAGLAIDDHSEVEWIAIRRDERMQYWPTDVSVVGE